MLSLTSKLAGLRRRWGVTTSVAIGAALALAATLVRSMMDPLLGALTPYAFVFPAIAFAAMIGGRSAGFSAMVVGQAAGFLLFIPPATTPDLARAQILTMAVVVATQAIIILAISGYFRSLEQLAEAERSRRELVEISLQELDHRTKNNFQLAVAILQLHANRNGNAEVKAELEAAAARLLSLESAHANLAVASGDIRTLSFAAYCNHLAERLNDGLLVDGVSLSVDVPDIAIDRDRAITIGMVLNELVTNSAKHAFPGGVGTISIMGEVVGEELHLRCVDDGVGGARATSGTVSVGSRLIDRLVERMGGSVTLLPGTGTGILLKSPL